MKIEDLDVIFTNNDDFENLVYSKLDRICADNSSFLPFDESEEGEKISIFLFAQKCLYNNLD